MLGRSHHLTPSLSALFEAEACRVGEVRAALRLALPRAGQFCHPDRFTGDPEVTICHGHLPLPRGALGSSVLAKEANSSLAGMDL